MKDNKSRNKKVAGRNEKAMEIRKTGTEDMDQLQREADTERSRKPGSQSNSSKRHNNGRGGGK